MADLNRPSVGRRALIALLLWAGFWVLALGLITLLAWIPIAQGLYAPGGVELSGIAAAFGALTLCYALRPRFAAKKERKEIEPLQPERYPKLFTLIREVAARCGTRAPDQVFLTIDATAWTAIERRWLGLERNSVVVLGLPLLAFLDRDELASVIAHEFGHHVGGDLSLGSWVHRTHRSLGAALSDLDGSAWLLDVPFRAYADLFLRVSRSASRAQELAADALAAKVCGARPTAGALRKVHHLAPEWSAYLTCDLFPAIGLEVKVPIVEGFRRFLREKRRRREVESALARSADRAPSRTDTHPELAERLRWLGATDRAIALVDETGCMELLGGEQPLEDAWYERSINGPLRALDWDALGEKALMPAIAKRLAGSPLDPRRMSLSALPGLLQQGAALWDSVAPRGLNLLSNEAKKRRAQELLTDWLSAALAARGFQAEADPGAALRLWRGEELVEPSVMIERLAAGELSDDAYREWCSDRDRLV